MVISEVNRYVFIGVPQTASTALAAELVENYAGRRIFQKHTDYAMFYRTASPEERNYRILATVRHPLDIVVSKFIKARDDHRNWYASNTVRDAPWGYRFRPEAREFAFISKHGPDFEKFVRRFYRRIYNSRACLLPDGTHVLRYEHLDEDLADWLKACGMRLIRPLPLRNTTARKDRRFEDWYDENLRPHAVRVFGPYMRRWSYEFPPDWPKMPPLPIDELWFKIDTQLRRFYLQKIHDGWVMPRSRRERVTQAAD